MKSLILYLVIFFSFTLEPTLKAQDRLDSSLNHNERTLLEERLRQSVLNESACEEYDLTHEFPEVRYQGQTGFCWAYALSDLISYKLGQRISAIDLALTNIQLDPLNQGISGFLSLTKPNLFHPTRSNYLGGLSMSGFQKRIKLLKHYGVCLEGDFIYSYDNDPDIFEKIESLHSELESSNALSTFEKNISLFKKVFPNIDYNQVYSAARVSSVSDFIYQISRLSCRRVHFNHVPMEMRSQLDEAWKLLSVGLKNGSPIVIVNNVHARLIVGQKKIGEKCMIKIRDSQSGMYWQELQKLEALKLVLL